LKYAVRLDFEGCANNVAEYDGLLLGLRKARVLGAQRLSIRSDSKLITGHINKFNRALKPELVKYLAAVWGMEKYFLGFSIRSFLMAQNILADKLEEAAAQQEPLSADVFLKTVRQGSVNCVEELAKFVNAISSEDWRTTIMAYVRGHFVP
jgi:ribonuclease HI